MQNGLLSEPIPARRMGRVGIITIPKTSIRMTPTSLARFLLDILAAFGELQRELIREQVNAGVGAAEARGKQIGRPKRIFRRNEAMRLRAEGMSWRNIAKALGVPVATLIDSNRKCRS
jgi:DNA invertase Pin-like site-specific DNA recombinase